MANHLVGGFVLWLVGIQFTAGWHLAATGRFEFVRGIGRGLLLVLAGIVVVALSRLAKLRIRGIDNGAALALGVVCIIGGFPMGALLGDIWNGIGGAYPDTSGLHNSLSTIVFTFIR
ncbi:MAG: hypothetical protein P4L46_07515 [Fimbriimonas sp.]|nr:hypothetical protein [Fimbriimonas sp.]